MSEPSNIVVLSLPRGRHALPVMRVLLSGVASRHKLSLDRLDDLQLAVETLLAEEPPTGADLGLRVRVEGDRLVVRLSGLVNQPVRDALTTSGPFQPQSGCLLDVRLFVSSLVDGYRVLEDEAGSYSVEMEKRAC